MPDGRDPMGARSERAMAYLNRYEHDIFVSYAHSELRRLVGATDHRHSQVRRYRPRPERGRSGRLVDGLQDFRQSAPHQAASG